MIPTLISLILGISVAQAPIKTPTPLDLWIEKLVVAESSGEEHAIGDGGKACGILQYHLATFLGQAKKHKDLFPFTEEQELENLYCDPTSQWKLTKAMLEENPQNWLHWYNSTKKIGLPPEGRWD
jgi:hypothetical protein